MGKRPFRDRIERALALGGLVMAAVPPLFLHVFRTLLRISTPEEREWAEIEEALYGRHVRSTGLGEAGQ
jgi:hypothetical protein